MQQGDYNSSASYYQYPPNPNPNPNYHPDPNLTDHHSNTLSSTYASAPPFVTNYSVSDYSPFSSTYPQNADPVPTIRPPMAPLYNPTPTPTPTPTQKPILQLFTPSPNEPPPAFQLLHDHHATYQQQQPYYPPYDQDQTAPRYTPTSSSFLPNPNPSLYGHIGSSIPAMNENLRDNNLKFDQGGGYFDDTSSKYGGSIGGYGASRSELGPDLYEKRAESGHGSGGYGNGYDVYAYQGNKTQPYGARDTTPKSATWSGFDDFGRPVSLLSGKYHQSSPAKIAKAVPKADTHQDVKSGVQKFRVKLLAESGGQSTTDVLCQIGLDGIRMLDPSTSRTLRIYHLETLTKFEVFDPSTFTFWSKSTVDIEPRRIRLQSNSYTTNTILDIVTAATVQLKEIGGIRKPSDSLKPNEQTAEKKKGLPDWMNLMKPGNEEKDHWVPDEAVAKCTACAADFNAFVRRHHCRNCGDIFCDKCTRGRIALTVDENAQPVRVCDRCMAEVTQRLSNAKEAASKSAGFQSHEDLAKKLQEVMERNRRPSSGFRSDVSSGGRTMKEVACPTCTAHLQVEVPISGSETIECGICQHPFLVTAN